MTRQQEMQRIIRRYKDETGNKEINMGEIADYAIRLGWPLPKPTNPRDRLAKDFSDAAREETRIDGRTGRPYRANHAITEWRQGELFTTWIDIDEAPRPRMLKSLVRRREQMVGDAWHLTLDQDHWNGINPNDEPINLPLDFGPDVDWRKNSPEEGAA